MSESDATQNSNLMDEASRSLGNFNTTAGYIARSAQAAAAMTGISGDEKSFSYRAALLRLGLTIVSREAAKVEDGDYPVGYMQHAPEEILAYAERDLIVVWKRIDHSTRKIVCAAIRGIDGTVIPSVRHNDVTMDLNIINCKSAETYICRPLEDEGFLDNNGIFLTRKEAFIVAERSSQLKPEGILKQDGLMDHYRRRWLFTEMIY